MFASAASLFPRAPAAQEDDTKTGPKPPPVPGPLLMTDCMTPSADGTLLLALWRRWHGEED